MCKRKKRQGEERRNHGRAFINVAVMMRTVLPPQADVMSLNIPLKRAHEISQTQTEVHTQSNY